ncbi:MAG: hypothetical protein ACXVEF_08180 [Polyangiales bacterium]
MVPNRQARGPRGATALAIVALGLHVSITRGAHGEGDALSPPPPTVSSATPNPSAQPVPWGSSEGGDTREGLDPLPSTGRYLTFGFSFLSEGLLATGNVCPKSASEKCVLGSGGGISFSGALRTPTYSLGAAYAATFHDSNNIYQRGVVQEARGEFRFRPREWTIGESINPFIGTGAGLAMFGDNWQVATIGLAGHGSVGVEFDLGVKVAVLFAITYRAIYFRSFDDASGQHRPAGLAQMLGLQLGLELHEPL